MKRLLKKYGTRAGLMNVLSILWNYIKTHRPPYTALFYIFTIVNVAIILFTTYLSSIVVGTACTYEGTSESNESAALFFQKLHTLIYKNNLESLLVSVFYFIKFWLQLVMVVVVVLAIWTIVYEYYNIKGFRSGQSN